MAQSHNGGGEGQLGFLAFGVVSLAVHAAKGTLGPPGGKAYKEKYRAPDPRSPPSQNKASRARMIGALAASERALMDTPEFKHVRALNELNIAEQAKFDRTTSHSVSKETGGWDKAHQMNAEYVAQQNEVGAQQAAGRKVRVPL